MGINAQKLPELLAKVFLLLVLGIFHVSTLAQPEANSTIQNEQAAEVEADLRFPD